MRWWAWGLIGLVIGAAGMYVFATGRLAEAQRQQDVALFTLDTATAKARATRDSLQAAVGQLAVRNAVLAQQAADARSMARAATTTGQQLRGQLADAQTAADSVPLLLGALELSENAAGHWEAAAWADSVRADSAMTALERVNTALTDQVAITERYKALAAVKPPDRVATMPLLHIPWPRLYAGLGATTNGKTVTPGLQIGVGFAL